MLCFVTSVKSDLINFVDYSARPPKMQGSQCKVNSNLNLHKPPLIRIPRYERTMAVKRPEVCGERLVHVTDFRTINTKYKIPIGRTRGFYSAYCDIIKEKNVHISYNYCRTTS